MKAILQPAPKICSINTELKYTLLFIIFRIMYIRNRLVLLALSLCVLTIPAPSSVSRYDSSVLDGFPEELAEHLIHSDDGTLARFCREVGIHYLHKNMNTLSNRIIELSPADEKGKLRSILHYKKRIAAVIKNEYNNHALLNYLIFLENQSPDRIHELTTMRLKLLEIYNDPDIGIESKIEMTHSIMDSFERYGDESGMMRAKHKLSELYADKGATARQFALLREVVAGFEKLGSHAITCQALGVLGVLYEKAGNIDSMIICYEKAKKIANLGRLPGQSARILTFYASHYIGLGRYAIAHDLFNEAMLTCREYKGGLHEFRFIRLAIKFYALLECWEIVERLYDRLNLLLGLHTWKDYDPVTNEVFLTRKDQILSQLHMARGNVVEAEQVLKRIRHRVKTLPYRTEYADLLQLWATGLFDNGEYSSASVKIREGLQYSKDKHLPRYAIQFSLLLAKTELKMGNYGNVKQALQHFDRHASNYTVELQLEWIEYYTTLGRLMLRTNEKENGLDALRMGLSLLKESAAGMDGSVHAYLWLEKCENLRQLMHDLVSDDPELGYGAELYWRNLYRVIGNGSSDDNRSYRSKPRQTPRSPLISDGLFHIEESFRSEADRAKRCIREHGAVHSLYLARDNRIWRWTVSKGIIRRETLDCSANELRRLVSETRNMLAEEDGYQGKAIQSGLIDNLRALARTLLPPEVADSSSARGPDLFLVTAEGFLGCIPFETFDIGNEGEYTPLLAKKDVAYARFIGCPKPGGTTTPGIILVNTHASKEIRKRYLFQPPLSEVHIEAETMAALDTNARILSGESATKVNLLQNWEGASYLYFATHTLSDPEVPYLVHIPLATAENNPGIEATYLDITDIRSTDLGGCDLVVLSGCSSGVPYVETHTYGPSLGDAFLDSGAGAVIQTFWDVRDDKARELMTLFVKLSDDMLSSPIHALCEARREIMWSQEGIRYPSLWASYSIDLGRFPVR